MISVIPLTVLDVLGTEDVSIFISPALTSLLFLSYQQISINWSCLIVLRLLALKHVLQWAAGVAKSPAFGSFSLSCSCVTRKQNYVLFIADTRISVP